MMSIKALGNLGSDGGAAKLAAFYYNEKSADYYIEDMKEKQIGVWMGEGAERLNLTGSVDREDFQLALAGHVGGREVQNAGDPKRQMGWDSTYSAPKSVSVLWAAAPSLREEIEQAHSIAVEEAHQYLISKITTRRGHLGAIKEKAAVISAGFTHHTSRAGDPQLHSHVVVPNFCIRSDGSVGTIESRAFYEYKMASGALYQAELAWRMGQLGFDVEKAEKGTFRLKEMGYNVERLFSKRDEAIDKIIKEQGIKTYAGTRNVVLMTRANKKSSTLEEREQFWNNELEKSGFSFEMSQSQEPVQMEEKSLGTIVDSASNKITNRQSIFREKEIMRELAISSMGQLNAKEIQELFKIAESEEQIINLGRDTTGKDIYTTQEMIEVERVMINRVEILAQNKGYAVDSNISITKRSFLKEEQKNSIQAATGESEIVIIQGRAGTGKTTMLSAVKESYQRKGWDVQGIAVSGQAAQNLQNEAGISSRTIASWRKNPQVNNNTVLIVDEAGMVGSKQMAEILDKSEKSGAKIILVGDERQLQPIDAGGALHAIDKKLLEIAPQYSSHMKTIRRQNDEWMREAVRNAACGKTAEALNILDAHDKINIYEKASQARDNLVNDYLQENIDKQKDALILTNRRSDANQINAQVRERLLEKGIIDKNNITVHNGQRNIELAQGDRIMFTRNNYDIDVRNGQRGVVENIDKKTEQADIELDNGQRKTINLKKYNHIEYGWASTTHKGQGVTVERTYVYGHSQETMSSQQSTYVQISRAKEETRLYVVSGEKSIERPELEKTGQKKEGTLAPMSKTTAQRQEAFKETQKNWSRDAAKDTTLDYYVQREPKQQQQNDHRNVQEYELELER